MRLLLNNLPGSLKNQRAAIENCLRAMDSVMPMRAVYLFGSHVREQARHDSDVDLCVVSDEAELQLAASRRLRIPIKPDTYSDPCRTAFRRIRKVIGAKRRCRSLI
jgi:predicted nucleotidyltransferase